VPSRINVVGTSGNGKTTFSRALAARLGVPYVELDALNHGPNWAEASDEDFRRRVAAAIQGRDGWVVDGN
jgi:adenylate kinase family enzyme